MDDKGAKNTNLLGNLQLPEGLKELSYQELEAVAAEIRELLISTIARTGGHLAPNLGVVELTLALHRVFNSPQDKIIWDVGHQSYVHKLLTGRLSRFSTLRQLGGISGFPRPEESEHDAFCHRSQQHLHFGGCWFGKSPGPLRGAPQDHRRDRRRFDDRGNGV